VLESLFSQGVFSTPRIAGGTPPRLQETRLQFGRFEMGRGQFDEQQQ